MNELTESCPAPLSRSALPVVVDAGIIEGYSALILWVIESVGSVNEPGGFRANYFVSMSDARRNSEFPRMGGSHK